MNDPGAEHPETTVSLRGVRASKRATEEEEFQPRYIGVTTWRDRGKGPRNLAWGSLLFILALILLAFGVHLAGVRALALVAASLSAAGVLFIAARSRLLRQRNGGFLALAFVALASALLVLSEQGWRMALVYGSTHRLDESSSDVVVARPVEPEIVALVDAYHLPVPSSSAARVKILRKAKVQIQGQTYLLRPGDLFIFAAKSGGEVRFTAANQQLALEEGFVDILAPESPVAAEPAATAVPVTPAPPAPVPSSGASVTPTPKPEEATDSIGQLTERAQRAAIKRYPGIGVKGSPENRAYVEMYQDLKNAGEDEYFKDPTWPLRLAEDVAAKEGWKSQNYEPMAGDGEPPAPAESVDSKAAAEPVEPRDDDAPSLPR